MQCQPKAMTGGAALQVDASAIRDLQDASHIEGYMLPKLYRTAGRFVELVLSLFCLYFRAWN